MNDIVPHDPDLPRLRKGIGSGLFFSALAILLILFSLGAIPQIDGLFNSADATLRGHNDFIVRGILQALPLVLMGIGVFGLTYVVLGRLNRQRRAA